MLATSNRVYKYICMQWFPQENEIHLTQVIKFKVLCLKCKDTIFYLLDYITLSGISKVQQLEKQNELEPKIQKISITSEALFYIIESYSKKVVNFSPKIK